MIDGYRIDVLVEETKWLKISLFHRWRFLLLVTLPLDVLKRRSKYSWSFKLVEKLAEIEPNDRQRVK